MPMAKDRSFRAGDVERFREMFSREKPDIVHTHATLSARVGARLAGVRTILSTRHCAKEMAEKPSFLYRKVYNSVTDLTVSTAMHAKRNLIAEGVAPEKICVIYNGSPRTARTTAQARETLKEALGIPRGALVLGSVARLEVVKGQDLMIEALSRLVREGKYDYHLVLVGTGSAEGMYHTLARELGLTGRVHFVGFSDTPHLFQNIFDINLNASRGTETSCLATSECMSLGVVTVASDFGGNSEMIHDGASGLLFPCEDVSALVGCIRRLSDDPKLYLALSSGARLLYENKYSLEQMALGYRTLYHSLR
jgi:glycosyltransferase involved in cell wall biosynthesis